MIPEAIIHAIKNTFNFSGYTDRMNYWTWTVIYLLIYSVAYGLQLMMGHPAQYDAELQKSLAETYGEATTIYPQWPTTTVFWIFALTNLSMLVRRLRDSGFGSANVYPYGIFYFFIPVLGQLYLIKWLATGSATPDMFTTSTSQYARWQKNQRINGN
jgi:uncharacterized membrane protein YhaH (DUF805 family)